MSIVDYVYFRTPEHKDSDKDSAFVGLVKNSDFKLNFKGCKEQVFTKPEFEKFIKGKRYKFLHVGFADQDDLDYLPEVLADCCEMFCPHLNAYRYFDLTPFEQMHGVQKFYLDWNLKIDKLWNILKNTNATYFQMTDFNKISDFSVFENSNIEDLELHGCNALSSFTNRLHVKDITFLLRMPRLKKLRLYIARDESDEVYLKTLAKLKNLEELHLDEGFFTFEQFAWLSAQLPNVKAGLEYAWYFKSLDTYSIIGRRKPRFLDDEVRREKYRLKYEELKKQFTNQLEPPKA